VEDDGQIISWASKAVTTVTSRCVIRCARADDFRSICLGIGDERFPLRLPLRQLLDQGQLATWLERMLAAALIGKAYLYSIDLNDGQPCIGQVSAVWREQAQDWALAFWLTPAYHGRGVAYEAVSAFLEYWFNDQTATHISVGVALWNAPSMRLITALGFDRVDAPAASARTAEGDEAIRWFALSRDQWAHRPSHRPVSC
jgi:RimJ/RimL family protein N-acetyltransferase